MTTYENVGTAIAGAHFTMSPANDRRQKFTLSGPPSRVGSPTPSLLREELLEKSLDDLPMDVYDATLPPWRAAVRRKLVASVHVESALIAKMQASSGGALTARALTHTPRMPSAHPGSTRISCTPLRWGATPSS